MINFPPIRASNGTPADTQRAIAEICARLTRLNILPSQTIEYRSTSAGFALEVKRSFGGGRTGAPPTKRLSIFAILTNTISCHPFTVAGAIDTTVSYAVAKPPVLRTADQTRNRSEGLGTIAEAIDPPYAIGDYIFACEVGDTGVATVPWIDLNVDARHWAPQFKTTRVCENGIEKCAEVIRSTTFTCPAN